MDERDAASRVAEWIEATVPDIRAAYDFPPAMKGALPDAIVEFRGSAISIGDRAFPFSQIEQTWVTLFEMRVSVMVDNSDEARAEQDLKRFAYLLRSAIIQDGTLGGRVPMTSPFVTFDFSAPYVEYEDGTRGREMVMDMTVAELVEDAR